MQFKKKGKAHDTFLLLTNSLSPQSSFHKLHRADKRTVLYTYSLINSVHLQPFLVIFSHANLQLSINLNIFALISELCVIYFNSKTKQSAAETTNMVLIEQFALNEKSVTTEEMMRH